mgnify:CR=1 FL=1
MFMHRNLSYYVNKHNILINICEFQHERVDHSVVCDRVPGSQPTASFSLKTQHLLDNALSPFPDIKASHTAKFQQRQDRELLNYFIALLTISIS